MKTIIIEVVQGFPVPRHPTRDDGRPYIVDGRRFLSEEQACEYWQVGPYLLRQLYCAALGIPYRRPEGLYWSPKSIAPADDSGANGVRSSRT